MRSFDNLLIQTPQDQSIDPPAIEAKMKPRRSPRFSKTLTFTRLPLELREQIYSDIITSTHTSYRTLHRWKNSNPPFITRLPASLRLNHQIVQEAAAVYLRHTQLVMQRFTELERALEKLAPSTWNNLRLLELVREPAPAMKVKHILERCPGLKNLTIDIPGKMIIGASGLSSCGDYACVFQHNKLERLDLICNEGDRRGIDNLKVGFKRWERIFKAEGRKSAKKIYLSLKITPKDNWDKPWKNPELYFYTEDNVTSYSYMDFFG